VPEVAGQGSHEKTRRHSVPGRFGLQPLRSRSREDNQSCVPGRSSRTQGSEEAGKGHEEGLEKAEKGAKQDVSGKREEKPLPETQLLSIP
jgi:hypothetical protein